MNATAIDAGFLSCLRTATDESTGSRATAEAATGASASKTGCDLWLCSPRDGRKN